MPLRAADAHYQAQQRQAAATLAAVESEWLKVGADFDAGWARVGPRMTVLLAAGQLGAARDGAQSVTDALSEQGISVDPVGTPAVRALAGKSYSLDGLTVGSLDSLLYGAVVHAREAPADSLEARLSAGAEFLRVVVPSQVADASRAAASVAITARPGIGYTRLVNPPCCQRCAPLAGRLYKVASFQRHPKCDCRMVPTNEANHEDAGSKIGPGDVKDLTKAQRQAIGDGADMNKVINSHRTYTNRDGSFTPSRSADRMTTTAFGKRRLTPEGIYRVSATREEALKRLRDNGYLLQSHRPP